MLTSKFCNSNFVLIFFRQLFFGQIIFLKYFYISFLIYQLLNFLEGRANTPNTGACIYSFRLSTRCSVLAVKTHASTPTNPLQYIKAKTTKITLKHHIQASLDFIRICCYLTSCCYLASCCHMLVSGTNLHTACAGEFIFVVRAFMNLFCA